MGFFSKKTKSIKPASETALKPFPPGDQRYPGSAGYSGAGLKKNAVPEHRFNFVRPDGKSES